MKAKRLLAFAMAGAMIIGTCTTAFAYDTYQGYTSIQDVNDPEDIVTATAHRAAAPLIDMLGANATSGFGMLNGSAPATLSDANNSLGIQIWGTAKNQVRDPYYANYYYNFYAAANSLTLATDVLINDDRSGSPIQADPQTTSLSTRPDVVIGVSSYANDSDDMDGYNSQLQAIWDSGEDYYPVLVAYDPTSLDTMIQTVNNAATAIDSVSGKTTRYAGAPYYLSATTIADKYEQYVQGIQGYIMANKTPKRVAIISDYQNGEYVIDGPGSNAGTSSNRYVEYMSKIATNVAGTNSSVSYPLTTLLNSTNNSGLGVEVIILNSRASAATKAQFSSDKTTMTNAGVQVIDAEPANLYGITMNSIENAMGLAYYAGKIYGTDSNSDPLNCYNLMRYFYSVFWHIVEDEVDNDAEGELLHDSLNGTTEQPPTSDTDQYSQSTIETALAAGETYYDAH